MFLPCADRLANIFQRSPKFTSTPQYGFFGKKPAEYKVINRISVSIFEEQNLRTLAQVADSYEEVDLAKTEFEHTRKNDFEQQVKETALQKILNQKAYYEKSLGVELIPIAFRDAKIQQRATNGAMAVEGLEEIVVTGIRNSSEKYDTAETNEPSFDEVVYEAELFVDYKIVNQNTR